MRSMTKEEYAVTQKVLNRLDEFESELESVLLDLEPLDLSNVDSEVRKETLRMFNYLSRTYILLADMIVYKDTLDEDITSGIIKIDME